MQSPYQVGRVVIAERLEQGAAESRDPLSSVSAQGAVLDETYSCSL